MIRALSAQGDRRRRLRSPVYFAKKPDIVILDEPSSALDPIAEFNMYKQHAGGFRGKDGILLFRIVFPLRGSQTGFISWSAEGLWSRAAMMN